MDIAHIYVYGVIDFWQDNHASEWGYVNLKDVKNQYEAQKNSEEIHVHIHSDGGVVTEGFAIHDFLRAQGKPVKTIIEGNCASIATVIALAGDVRVMTSNSNFFIHNPWGFAGGDKEEIQKYADELDKMEGQIADFYASKTSITSDEALELMKAETSFTPEEALKKGFITEIASVMKAVALYKPNHKNMSKETLTKDEAQSMLDGFLTKIKNALKGKTKPVNKIVQDATGQEIDFYELDEDASPSIGDKATIDNSPADGEILMPSGETYVFVSGELTEIKPSEEDETEEMENLKNEISDLKTELSQKDQTISELKNENKEFKSTLKEMKKDFKDLKKAIGSDFSHEPGNNKKKNQKSERDFSFKKK